MKNKITGQINFIYIIIFLFITSNYIPLVFSSNYISMKIINYNNELINKIEDNSYTVEDFKKTKIENPIYTRIKIGEPPQEVTTWIDSEEYSYFIFKDLCIINSDFNENKSSTFEPNYDKLFFYNGYGQTIYINETFILNNDIKNNKEIKIQKFPIMFMKDPKNDEYYKQRFSLDGITGKTCATIGFRYITNYRDLTSKNFLLVLKDKDIIDDYTVFFEYDKKGDEQYIVFGGYPEEIYPNKKFSLENQKTTNIKLYNRFKPQWGFACDKILSGKEKLDKVDVAFHHNLGVIYGPKYYRDRIEGSFFNKYFDMKICNKKVDEQFTVFYCDKEKFTVDEMKKFPEIKFFKNDLEEIFNLTYTDLFYNKVNNIYFLIVFNHLYDEIWELGKPFLSKFFFAYNFDSKIIWYYKDIENGNEEKRDKIKIREVKDNKSIIYRILFLSIFFGFIFFFIGRILYNRRNGKLINATELEKKFSYQEKNKLMEE